MSADVEVAISIGLFLLGILLLIKNTKYGIMFFIGAWLIGRINLALTMLGSIAASLRNISKEAK